MDRDARGEPQLGKEARRRGEQDECDKAGASRRTKQPLVVAFVDVDGLKWMNDNHGHAAGDQLLREVVRSIQQALRSYDVVARYGGDEFICALLGDLSTIHQRFVQVASKLRKATNGLTITTGLAQMLPEDSLEDLVGRADAAMIAARRDQSTPVT